MKSSKKVTFIISSGRSGSQLFFRLFDKLNYVDSNHELNIMKYKPEIVKYQYTNSLKDRGSLENSLEKFYYEKINLSKKTHWIDSNYSIAPIINIIMKKFPNANIIHLIRSGVKVVSSWKYKLGNEIYGSSEYLELIDYLKNRDSIKCPVRKKNWWYVPKPSTALSNVFQEANQFEKICYHWLLTYSWVNNYGSSHLSPSNYLVVKLEELVNSEETLKNIFNFLDISYNPKYFESIQKPHNVNKPHNYTLSKEEHDAFVKICGKLMKELDYDSYDEYKVNY